MPTSKQQKMILNNSLEATHDIAASIGEINKASPKIVQEKSQKKKKKLKGKKGKGPSSSWE